MCLEVRKGIGGNRGVLRRIFGVRGPGLGSFADCHGYKFRVERGLGIWQRLTQEVLIRAAELSGH